MPQGKPGGGRNGARYSGRYTASKKRLNHTWQHSSGYNEISLDDTRGQEKINIRAEHDLWGLHERREQIGDRTSLKVGGDAAAEYVRNHAERVGGERYLKAERLVIEAGAEISLQVGGDHVVINRGGVFIDGKVVDLNCGYAAAGTTLGRLSPFLPVKDPDLVKTAWAAPALPAAAPPPAAPSQAPRIRSASAVASGGCQGAWDRVKSEVQKIDSMSDVRERNRAISASYARLYLAEPDLKWARAAAFASKQVGDGMDAFGATVSLAKSAFAKGNVAVYDELDPALRFYQQNKEVISNDQIMKCMDQKPGPLLDLAITKGLLETMGGDPASGGLTMLKHEQRVVTGGSGRHCRIRCVARCRCCGHHAGARKSR